jgi:hypothetical protein
MANTDGVLPIAALKATPIRKESTEIANTDALIPIARPFRYSIRKSKVGFKEFVFQFNANRSVSSRISFLHL